MKKSNIVFALSFVLMMGGFCLHWYNNTTYINGGYVNGPIFDYKSMDYVVKVLDYSNEEELCFHFEDKKKAEFIKQEIVSLQYSENSKEILKHIIAEYNGNNSSERNQR